MEKEREKAKEKLENRGGEQGSGFAENQLGTLESDGGLESMYLGTLKTNERNWRITSADKLLRTGKVWKNWGGTIELSYKYE